MNRSEILMAEYTELGLCWRHDDQIFHNLTGILLPITLGTITIPFMNDDIPRLPVFLGSLILISFWYLSSFRYDRRHITRYKRIHEIEEELGLDSHLKFRNAKQGIPFKLLRVSIYISYLLIIGFTFLVHR